VTSVQTPQRPHDDPRLVAAMFARISRRYDLLNRLLSFGRDAGWRRYAANQAGLRPGDRALDIATGTADLAFELYKRVGPQGKVAGLDITREMLLLGRAKLETRPERYVDLHEGDAMSLPYSDSVFQAATMAFGGRNVPDLTGAFREMHRVLRPGGKAVFLELNRPHVWGFRHLFDFYFHTVSPLVGGLISGDRSAYEYLPKSVDKFEEVGDIADCMKTAGFIEVRVKRLMFGVANVHVGTAPGA
jgi:demethylmenaquinone methyltransferase/2-methoxy-6-polyprenyl-1,4-benzoquinol methylase